MEKLVFIVLFLLLGIISANAGSWGFKNPMGPTILSEDAIKISKTGRCVMIEEEWGYLTYNYRKQVVCPENYLEIAARQSEKIINQAVQNATIAGQQARIKEEVRQRNEKINKFNSTLITLLNSENKWVKACAVEISNWVDKKLIDQTNYWDQSLLGTCKNIKNKFGFDVFTYLAESALSKNIVWSQNDPKTRYLVLNYAYYLNYEFGHDIFFKTIQTMEEENLRLGSHLYSIDLELIETIYKTNNWQN